ncbi:MAG: hypothetical protein M3O22_08385 [Pseudomonadota bacterium]|nr:hypothetical protein [Pseudomonadota bacterium]
MGKTGTGNTPAPTPSGSRRNTPAKTSKKSGSGYAGDVLNKTTWGRRAWNWAKTPLLLFFFGITTVLTALLKNSQDEVQGAVETAVKRSTGSLERELEREKERFEQEKSRLRSDWGKEKERLEGVLEQARTDQQNTLVQLDTLQETWEENCITAALSSNGVSRNGLQIELREKYVRVRRENAENGRPYAQIWVDNQPAPENADDQEIPARAYTYESRKKDDKNKYISYDLGAALEQDGKPAGDYFGMIAQGKLDATIPDFDANWLYRTVRWCRQTAAGARAVHDELEARQKAQNATGVPGQTPDGGTALPVAGAPAP